MTITTLIQTIFGGLATFPLLAIPYRQLPRIASLSQDAGFQTVFCLPGGGSEVFDFTTIGKLLLAGIGVALLLSGKIPWLGRLPGDLLFQGKHSSFYFPLTTSILISVVLTLIIWFINRR
jgi:hypothetical protein